MKSILLGAMALTLIGGAAFAQRADSRDAGRGAGPRYERAPSDSQGRRDNEDRRYAKGDSIPYDHMVGGKYIYYNWRSAGLRQPPRGFAWLLIGGQYLLTDQKSGEVRDVRDTPVRRASFARGGRVPYDYMPGGKYIYYNWRTAGLREPPPGYEWMLIDGQFILADQKTGQIRDVRRAEGYRN